MANTLESSKTMLTKSAKHLIVTVDIKRLAKKIEERQFKKAPINIDWVKVTKPNLLIFVNDILIEQ